MTQPATITIRYVGPHVDGVHVHIGGGRYHPVKHGETWNAPRVLAETLLDQHPNWERVQPAKAGKDGGES